MTNEMNIIYYPKEKNYILLTEKHWKDALYQSRINLGNKIEEDTIIEEMKKIKIDEVKLSSIPIRGYEILSIDKLLNIKDNIIRKDISLKIILPESTTP